MRFIVSRKDEGYSFKEYIKPYFKKKVFAILSIKDPLPFVKRCLHMVSITIQKSVEIVKKLFN